MERHEGIMIMGPVGGAQDKFISLGAINQTRDSTTKAKKSSGPYNSERKNVNQVGNHCPTSIKTLNKYNTTETDQAERELQGNRTHSPRTSSPIRPSLIRKQPTRGRIKQTQGRYLLEKNTKDVTGAFNDETLPTKGSGHCKTSTENLHLSVHRPNNNTTPIVTLSRSLPGSPTMSPRLLRRCQENSTAFLSKTNILPCPPVSPKSNRKNSPKLGNNTPFSRTLSPLFKSNSDKKQIEPLTVTCADNEEIHVLNLPQQNKKMALDDDVMMQFKLRRVKSLEPTDLPFPKSSLIQRETKPDNTWRKNEKKGRCHSVSLPNSPPRTPQPDDDGETNSCYAYPTKHYLANRRRTIAFDRGIQVRKTFQEWLEVKTDETRRRSLNVQHMKDLERIREQQFLKERFERAKTFEEWKNEKEEISRKHTIETKEKRKEISDKEQQKQQEIEELRTKKYDAWLDKKFTAELEEEERKIQELRNRRTSIKENVRRVKSK